jgi:deferrochelatase/peroxidase EfeB
MDGISQPGVEGFTTNPTPGQAVLKPGIFLLGTDGDSATRPSWTTGGTFMAFRQMKQLVPEFNQFLTDNALQVPGLSADEGAELLGARMVGRWKSVSQA